MSRRDPEPDLHAAHALDAADQGQGRAAAREHSRRLEGADHAGAALHDGGERRHVRIELGLEPDLARQVGIGEIGDDRAPDAEIDRALHARGHGLHDRHRQGQRVTVCKRSVDPHEGGCGRRRPARSCVRCSPW